MPSLTSIKYYQTRQQLHMYIEPVCVRLLVRNAVVYLYNQGYKEGNATNIDRKR